MTAVHATAARTRRPLASSYRDPAGYMIFDDGLYKRVVTERGRSDYSHYMRCGLHDDLAEAGLVLDHREERPPDGEPAWANLLVPEQLRFVSYPYEWSFQQLKDAALLTLEVQRRALAKGMTLKDASAYNIQFRGSRPVFIDTLSFERNSGGPWPAYQQFCEHFLGTLALMSYRTPDANRYLQVDVDGFSLSRVAQRLPLRSYLNPGILLHIHLHSRALKNASAPSPSKTSAVADPKPALTDSLRSAIHSLKPPGFNGVWSGYYSESRFYSGTALASKQLAIRELAGFCNPSLVFDLGANTGLFTREFAALGADCIAFDSDPACVNALYLEQKQQSESKILPLVMDMANPSPGVGFGSQGTLGLFERPQADLVLCLALMHHLRITRNLPVHRLAEFLSRLGRSLIIEFVPSADPAARALTSRSDFDDWTPSAFVRSFETYFHTISMRPIADSARTLFLFQRRA